MVSRQFGQARIEFARKTIRESSKLGSTYIWFQKEPHILQGGTFVSLMYWILSLRLFLASDAARLRLRVRRLVRASGNSRLPHHGFMSQACYSYIDNSSPVTRCPVARVSVRSACLVDTDSVGLWCGLAHQPCSGDSGSRFFI